MTDRSLVHDGAADVTVTESVGRRVTWSAVIAGVIAALTIHLLLNMLGVGVGATFVDPATDGSPDAATLGIGAVAWWAIVGIIAAFGGGVVAGACLNRATNQEGVLHGFLSWALTTLVIAYLITTAATTAAGTLGGLAGPVAQRLAQTPAAERALDTTAQNPQSAAQQAQSAAQDVQNQLGVTPQDAAQVAEQSADALAQGAIWSFIALVIGGVAAAIGGRAGAGMAYTGRPATVRTTT